MMMGCNDESHVASHMCAQVEYDYMYLRPGVSLPPPSPSEHEPPQLTVTPFLLVSLL